MPSLFESAPSKPPFAVRLFEALGIAPDRITAEEQSRNTIENAVFSRLIAQPKPGERWLLVTSAFHMPRAIAAFRAAGFPVEAYPVDWRTRGPIDATRLFSSVAVGLAQTDLAMHEWVGLLAYRLTGKTTELFPAPIAARAAACRHLPILHSCGSILCRCASSFGEGLLMSTDMPAALVDQPAEAAPRPQPATSEWAETALTVLFTAAAVLFVSFVAVVTGLV